MRRVEIFEMKMVESACSEIIIAPDILSTVFVLRPHL
jgi:hypothetical protein